MVNDVNEDSTKTFAEDSNVVEKKYCTETGLLATSKCKNTAVGEYIEVEQRDVADFTYPDGCTVVLCNPPYGERMLDEEQAHELYKVMEIGRAHV